MISQNTLVKLDRIAAWVLLFVIIAYAITGFGMTKGLISAEFSRSAHLGWLGAIGLAAFIIHTSWAIHLFLIRKNIWNSVTKFILALAYVCLVGFFIWAQFFYSSSDYSDRKHQLDNNTVSTTNNAVATGTVFTAETIAQYNGKNSQPSYVAVDGVVYDVSTLFVNGYHRGCAAGQDVTDDFYAERKHFAEMLKNYQMVGTYQE